MLNPNLSKPRPAWPWTFPAQGSPGLGYSPLTHHLCFVPPPWRSPRALFGFSWWEESGGPAAFQELEGTRGQGEFGEHTGAAGTAIPAQLLSFVSLRPGDWQWRLQSLFPFFYFFFIKLIFTFSLLLSRGFPTKWDFPKETPLIPVLPGHSQNDSTVSEIWV